MNNFLNLVFDFFKQLAEKENLAARILSVIAATMIWVYVSVDNNPIVERTYEVHLNQLNLPKAMTVYNAPDKISVRIRGSRTIMTEKLVSEISATVDFKNVTEGQQKLPVKVRSKKGDIVAVSPSNVSVYVDTISQKTVPVQTRMVGTIPEDMTLGNVTIKPNSVSISGATHRLDKVHMVVAPVDVTDRNGSFDTESELVAVSDDGYDIPNMIIAPQRVAVSAVMVPQMLTVELPVELVTTGEPPEGMDMKPSVIKPTKVKVSAAPSKLKGITVIKTKPLDITKLVDKSTSAVELDLPEQAISNVRIVQATINYAKHDSETVRESVNEGSEKTQETKEHKHEAKN